MGYCPRGQRTPEDSADLQGQPPQSGRMSWSNVLYKQKYYREPAWFNRGHQLSSNIRKEVHRVRNWDKLPRWNTECLQRLWWKCPKVTCCFSSHIRNRRKAEENVGLLINGASDKVTWKTLRCSPTGSVRMSEELWRLKADHKSVTSGQKPLQLWCSLILSPAFIILFLSPALIFRMILLSKCPLRQKIPSFDSHSETPAKGSKDSCTSSFWTEILFQTLSDVPMYVVEPIYVWKGIKHLILQQKWV